MCKPPVVPPEVHARRRLYVHADIYDAFVAKSVELAKARVVGDPFDEKTQQGPQVDRDQFNSILSYIKTGCEQGATLGTGCCPPACLADCTRGCAASARHHGVQHECRLRPRGGRACRPAGRRVHCGAASRAQQARVQAASGWARRASTSSPPSSQTSRTT